MASWKTRITNGLLNIALWASLFITLILLYGVATRTLFHAPTPERSSDSSGLVGSVIQVEVRNGVGVDGVAAKTTQYLRDQGFDVVSVGNYSSFNQEESVVLDRVGNPEAARKVAKALGVPMSRVQQEIRRQYYLDASVILGHDYEQLRPFR